VELKAKIFVIDGDPIERLQLEGDKRVSIVILKLHL
jgi:hypothetical protein